MPVNRRKILAWAAFGTAALCAAAWISLAPQAAPSPERSARVASHRSAPAESRFSLPAREPVGSPGEGLFKTPPDEPPRRAGVVRAKPEPQAPAVQQPPAPPPMPYRVAGKVIRGGVLRVLLARGDELITAREGETVEQRYRVESISAEKVTLVYLPLELKQELPVVSALAPAPANVQAAQASSAPPAQVTAAARGASVSGERARLSWQGPERVRAGDRFEVVLRITSGEALRAAPLKIAFDASVLEAVAVRAGRFFEGGAFSYRIDPGGSIFVGASGKGIPAANAELFVASFKPIKPAAAAAELRVSALMLQGASGQVVLHERPVAFRTTIVER
jgi:hypothetical protein